MGFGENRYEDITICLGDYLYEIIDALDSIRVRVNEIYDTTYRTCPNRRVAHLMKYGKKARVRNKNFIRANKILITQGD